MNAAIWSRVLQFRAGPESYMFHGCQEHVGDLESGEVGGGNFFITTDEPVKLVEQLGEIECDLCREG